MNRDHGKSSGFDLIDPGGDFLQTLKNCEGYYVCSVDVNGWPQGPLVGYTAKYKDDDGSEKNWVGFVYYNFAKADMWPDVLEYFAYEMASKLATAGLSPDIIVGAPWAGVKFSQAVAHSYGCRHIFAEKKGDDIILGRYEGEIRPGDKVIIGEELVNNASTTAKLVSLIESSGGIVIAVICAINRSSPFRNFIGTNSSSVLIPILGVIERETPQYRQNDPAVSKAVTDGQVVWKPKYEWHRMKAAGGQTNQPT